VRIGLDLAVGAVVEAQHTFQALYEAPLALEQAAEQAARLGFAGLCHGRSVAQPRPMTS
jgi:hypothetical protein